MTQEQQKAEEKLPENIVVSCLLCGVHLTTSKDNPQYSCANCQNNHDK